MYKIYINSFLSQIKALQSQVDCLSLQLKTLERELERSKTHTIEEKTEETTQ